MTATAGVLMRSSADAALVATADIRSALEFLLTVTKAENWTGERARDAAGLLRHAADQVETLACLAPAHDLPAGVVDLAERRQLRHAGGRR